MYTNTEDKAFIQVLFVAKYGSASYPEDMDTYGARWVSGTQPPYKNELENFLSTHVMKCFESPFAFLRAKACWVTGQYSDIRFTEGFGRGPLFQALLQHALTLMRDSELPVGPLLSTSAY